MTADIWFFKALLMLALEEKDPEKWLLGVMNDKASISLLTAASGNVVQVTLAGKNVTLAQPTKDSVINVDSMMSVLGKLVWIIRVVKLKFGDKWKEALNQWIISYQSPVRRAVWGWYPPGPSPYVLDKVGL